MSSLEGLKAYISSLHPDLKPNGSKLISIRRETEASDSHSFPHLPSPKFAFPQMAQK